MTMKRIARDSSWPKKLLPLPIGNSDWGEVKAGYWSVAKEGVLSGLNNPKVYSVFDEPFSDCFGFTADEVRELLATYGHPEKMDEAKAWFLNGKGQRYYSLKFAKTYYGEMTHYGLYRLAWADVRRTR